MRLILLAAPVCVCAPGQELDGRKRWVEFSPGFRRGAQSTARRGSVAGRRVLLRVCPALASAAARAPCLSSGGIVKPASAYG